uniref:Uncharacterized protein n=1 Tax=Tanacetum cinerariifolium TaxID=118510 RepID=A0A6L2NU59_TANCI|nr:hypothetical protein [Tanacetum cinerariifolium]
MAGRSSSNSQNVAFVSAESTNSTNELNAAYSVSIAIGHSSRAQGSSSYANEHMFLFFANQSSTPHLDKEDLEQIDQDDLEEIDLKWQRPTRTSRNMSRDVGNAGYIRRDNGKRPANEENAQALVVQDGLGIYEWSYQVEEEATDFALMAFTSNPSSSSSSNSEEEVTKTMFDNHSSAKENSIANDRFKKGEGYHAVPPPLTGNYMPPKPDLSFAGLDDSIYKFKISETVTSLAKDENDAFETSTAFVEKPKEDRSSAPLIEDWETNNDDDNVFTPKPIPTKIDFMKAGESIKHVKPVEYVKHDHLQQALKNKRKVNSGGPQDTNGNAGTQENVDAGKKMSDQHYIVLPLWSFISSTYKSSDDKPADDKPKDDTGSKIVEEPVNKDDQAYRDELDMLISQEKEASDAVDAHRKEFKQGCMDQMSY